VGSSCPVTVGDGDARVGGARDAGGNARDDFEGDVGMGKLSRFFTAAPEDKGVASFEAGDDFSAVSFINAELVEFFLRDGVVFGAFASVDELAVTFGELEEFGG